MSGAACASGVGSGIVAYPDITTEEIPGALFYTLHTNGTITYTGNTTGLLRWVSNTAPTNYEVRFGGAGSWLDFSTDRTINATSQIELRDKYTAVTVKNVTVTFG